MTLARISLEEEHQLFRSSVRQFFSKEVVPNLDTWERAQIVPRHIFEHASKLGFMSMEAPERFGGGGIRDFRFNMILAEEIMRVNAYGVGATMILHTDVVLPYLLRYGTEEQQDRWLPNVVSGRSLLAIAMTEPGAGSDLGAISTTAVRDGDGYIVNGSKAFVTSGLNADLVVTAVKTDPAKRHSGISLLMLERGMPGFDRGPALSKIGLNAQDTAGLFFNDVHVPVSNLLGAEGRGFEYLMANLPQERISIAVCAVSGAEAALEWTLEYVKGRTAFGQAIGTFQHSRFVLAEIATEARIVRVFVDRCVEDLIEGVLSPDEAAMAKWWSTDFQNRTVDRCLQLFGGYGYMKEYPIARAFVDARITPIFGGTNEIMKEIVGRSLGL